MHILFDQRLILSLMIKQLILNLNLMSSILCQNQKVTPKGARQSLEYNSYHKLQVIKLYLKMF
jgi:hypothetical protein